MRYVALLRGINVGGKNLMSMADLRAAFEAHGLDEVATYIQSGNVLFETNRARKGLADEIEDMLSERFGKPVTVVLRSHRQLARIVANAPEGFGSAPERYLSDVIFLKEPLTVEAAMRDVATRDGVDEAWTGTGVLYFARLQSDASRSRLSRVVGKPVYQRMTIRSWSTTTKLLALLDERAA